MHAEGLLSVWLRSQAYINFQNETFNRVRGDRRITSKADFAFLQQDIDSVSNWVDKNHLQ